MQYIVEIIVYRLNPGTADDFHAVMTEVSAPLHRRHGLDIVWHGRTLHVPDGYGLIRCFRNMAVLEASQADFYASDAWRSGPREAIVSRIAETLKLVLPMDSAAVEAIRRQGDGMALG